MLTASPLLYRVWRKVCERTMYSAMKSGRSQNNSKVPLNKALNSKFLQGCCIAAKPVLCEETPVCIYIEYVCRMRHSRYLTIKRTDLIQRSILYTTQNVLKFGVNSRFFMFAHKMQDWNIIWWAFNNKRLATPARLSTLNIKCRLSHKAIDCQYLMLQLSRAHPV